MSLLSIIPGKVWAGVAIAGALIIGVGGIHHRGFKSGVASMQAKLDAATLRASQAEAANSSAAGVIARLRLDKQSCESGRLADQTAAAKALAGNDAQSAAILTQLKRTKAQIEAVMRGECKTWAEQASCGI